MLRRQLPVYSPVTWEAIVAGARAALAGDREGRARRRVVDMLCARYGARDALLTDSGTSALRLAIAGAVVGEDRPVALPGYGCYDLATAAEGAGASVVLYDVEPETLGPSQGALESLAEFEPAAVVLAHQFGYPVDVRAARRAIPEDVPIIEDAAQAAGGRLGGRPLGSFGSVSVLSFGRGKGMTGGGGGALLAHDDRGLEVLEHARAAMAAQGRAPRGTSKVAGLLAQRTLGRPALYGLPASLPFLHLGETRYRPPHPPSAMPVVCLAALERIVDAADREVEVRRRHAARLLRLMERSAHLQGIDPVPGAEPGYLRLPALLSSDALGRQTRAYEGRLGITSMYPMTLAGLPTLASRLVMTEPTMPGAEALTRRLVTLPTHGLLAERDLRAIEEAVVER